jgi:hypothetical protein
MEKNFVDKMGYLNKNDEDSFYPKNLWISFILVIASIFLLPNISESCPSCFGSGINTEDAKNISMAVLLLMGTTGGVLSGVVLFFISMAKRARRFKLPEHLDTMEDDD